MRWFEELAQRVAGGRAVAQGPPDAAVSCGLHEGRLKPNGEPSRLRVARQQSIALHPLKRRFFEPSVGIVHVLLPGRDRNQDALDSLGVCLWTCSRTGSVSGRASHLHAERVANGIVDRSGTRRSVAHRVPQAGVQDRRVQKLGRGTLSSQDRAKR
jgi:hypothetical protein